MNAFINIFKQGVSVFSLLTYLDDEILEQKLVYQFNFLLSTSYSLDAVFLTSASTPKTSYRRHPEILIQEPIRCSEYHRRNFRKPTISIRKNVISRNYIKKFLEMKKYFIGLPDDWARTYFILPHPPLQKRKLIWSLSLTIITSSMIT